MRRKMKQINVVIHLPDDEISLEAIQRVTDDMYAHMIEDTLSKSGLTPGEAEYVVKEVIAALSI